MSERTASWQLVDDRRIYVVASPFKTATTSVGRALVDLGVGTRDMGYRAKLLNRVKPIKAGLNNAVDEARSPRRWLWANSGQIRRDFQFLIEAIREFDVFSDAPFGHIHIHPAVRKVLMPNAKFIWVNREFDDWIESVRNWEVSHPETYVNAHLWGTDPEKRITRLKKNWTLNQARYRAAANLFPEDFAEVNLSDLTSFRPLCDLYDAEDPGTPFPLKNVSRDKLKDV